MEALVSATVTAAEVLGISDELGTLSPGMRADVIATPGNPLEDIDSMMDIGFVMKDGLVYKDEGSVVRPTLAPRG
jgi:imidazolonepropionase-like amidohydrolase